MNKYVDFLLLPTTTSTSLINPGIHSPSTTSLNTLPGSISASGVGKNAKEKRERTICPAPSVPSSCPQICEFATYHANLEHRTMMSSTRVEGLITPFNGCWCRCQKMMGFYDAPTPPVLLKTSSSRALLSTRGSTTLRRGHLQANNLFS